MSFAAGVLLMLVSLWVGIFSLLFAPLERPSAMDACAEPCFGPPSDYGEVLLGAGYTTIVLAVAALVATAGTALLSLALRGRRLNARRFVTVPLSAGALGTAVIAVAQLLAVVR